MNEIKTKRIFSKKVNGRNPYQQLSKTLTLILMAGRLKEPFKNGSGRFLKHE
jgi:hypothetical protein